jgi:predicted ATPase
MTLSSVQRLFGRETELSRLLEALEQAHSGGGRLVLLVGEAGIGKTRLADALCERARASASVHWGRCWEAGGAPAYWPWVQILRGVIGELDARSSKAAIRASAADLIALVPELRKELPDCPEPAPEDSAEARFRVFDSVATFLRKAAVDRTLVLVLDDLHVADVPSLLLLRFVARSLQGSRILMLGAYRDAEARLAPAASAVIAEIEREGERLTPRRLARLEIRELVRDVCNVDPEERVLDALTAFTDGNPLFVGEAVRLTWADGVPGTPASAAMMRLSQGVESTIRGRLALLGPAARRVLELGAVIGREFELDLLRAASGENSETLLEHLAEAVRVGISSELDVVPTRYRFSHFLVREALYRDLNPADRCRLHAAVAGGLERLHGDAPEDHAVELAHHFLLAAEAGDPNKTVQYSARAGERALRIFAYEEAANWLQRALAISADAPPANPRDKIELLLLLAESRMRAGQRSEAAKACRDAAALARETGAPDLLARAALTLGSEIVAQVVDPALVELLEDALERLDAAAHGALRLRVMARLAAALQPASDQEVPTALARNAIAQARSSADRATLAQVLHSARAAYMPLDSLEERASIDAESLALAYETNQRGLALQARQRLVYSTLEQGDLAAALRHVEAYEHLAEELRSPSHRFAAKLGRHNLAAMIGQFEQSQQQLGEAAALSAATGDPNAGFMLALGELHLCRAACRGHRIPELIERLVAASSSFSHPLMPRYCEAIARARAGTVDALQRAFDAIPPEALPVRLGGQGLLAEVCFKLGDRARAAIFYERLLPWASRYQGYLSCEGSFSRPLALLAMTLERWDDARRHFEDALVFNDAIGARPWWAQAAAAYADLLSSRGTVADERRAAELRSRARAIAIELGMTDLVTGLGAETGARPPEASAPAFDRSQALRLEGDYWSVTFEGRTFRLKDSRGLRMLSQLVQNPGREFHVLDLSSAGEHEEQRALAGDAGAMLDTAAKATYAKRARELREDIEEAERWHDDARAARSRAELEWLTEELARGVGLGGRDRKAASAVERARVNVQRRLSDAIRRIAENSPALGGHLTRTIKTGAYCSYRCDDQADS